MALGVLASGHFPSKVAREHYVARRARIERWLSNVFGVTVDERGVAAP